MSGSRMTRLLQSTLLLTPVLAFTAAAQSADSSDVNQEFWPEFDVYVKINEHARIFALYTATKQENLNTSQTGRPESISTSTA